MEYCKNFRSCHIEFCVSSQTINISRCCLNSRFPLKSFTIDEWKSLPNKISVLNSLVDVWPNRPGEREIRKGICEVHSNAKVCFYDKPLGCFNSFEVALDLSCNAKCVWCGQKENFQKAKELGILNSLKELYYETLYEIASDNNVSNIRLTDIGEPLYWKKDFINFITSIDNTKSVHIITNGLNLCDEDVFTSLKNKNINIACSINALTEETHLKTMGIPKLFDIIKKVDELSKINNKEYVFTYVVSSKDDYDEIKQHLSAFREITQLPIIFNYESSKNELRELTQELNASLISSRLSL